MSSLGFKYDLGEVVGHRLGGVMRREAVRVRETRPMLRLPMLILARLFQERLGGGVGRFYEVRAADAITISQWFHENELVPFEDEGEEAHA